MYLPLTVYAAVAAAAPYPLAKFSFDSAAIHIRQSEYDSLPGAHCDTPGALVCNGTTQFGLCTQWNKIVFMSVAAGTECSCTSEDNVCTIIAASSTSQESMVSETTMAPTASPSSTLAASPYSSDVVSTSTNAAATSSLVSQTPSSHPSPTAGSGGGGSTGSAYTQFNGDGSVAAGWPSISDWLSFDQLWEAYMPLLQTGCTTSWQLPNNTPEEIDQIHYALLTVSEAANVPSNFALAIMMQESIGCARIQTTNNGVTNPGLFQSHNGSGTCWLQATCSEEDITQMVKDGITGTAAGAGLEQCGQQAQSSDAQEWYMAARMYNSGSLSASGDLGAPGATACYCSDIANRLIGWTSGTSKCTL